MGKYHLHDQKNGGEIFLRKLRHGGTCDPIGVDIFTKYHKEYGIHVCRRREASPGKLFAVPFLQKIEIYHIPCSNSKYDSGEEGRPGPSKTPYRLRTKITEFTMCKHGADLVCDRGKRIFHRLSPLGSQGGK